MNKHTSLLPLLVLSFWMTFSSSNVEAQGNQAGADVDVSTLTNYPRVEKFENGTVQVDFPTIDVWPEFRLIKAWQPVEVRLKADGKSHVGSAYVQAHTTIDFEKRTVSIQDLEVVKTKFEDNTENSAVQQLVRQAFQGRESIVPLDILLRLLPDNFEIPVTSTVVSRLNFAAPEIIVSETPLKLLSIDKEPVKAEVRGTDLEWVVNTNWNVFYYKTDAKWYVLNGETWQENNYLSNGGWVSVDQLPADFDRLALDDNWEEVQQAFPARIPETPPTPFAISLQETELVQLEGAPQLTDIKETGISYVNNTESDLFRFSGKWYLLVSGRWFENNELSGRWDSAGDLPDAFAQIPSDHAKGHALFSVPGTRQARLSLIEASLPHQVTVGKSAGPAQEVVWIGEPRFEIIDTTSLERGMNTPFQIIKHNNYYYLCYEGAWYFSNIPTGGWKAAQQIPEEIYRIPPTDPAFNVTFVRLDTQQAESQPYVNYQYSAGYKGSFSTKVSVVYGTGWYYPTNVYWDSNSGPAYWNTWRTYGYNIGYNPVGAHYGGRGFYRPGGMYGGWGPYGYWGGYRVQSTITIDSPTQNFNHGYGSAWEGPLQTTPGDPTKNTDRSLDQFLPKKKVSGEEVFVNTAKDGVAKPAKVSASSLYASSSLSSNRFSGPGGEVYKHDGQEWSQYNEGNWDTMNTLEQENRTPVRQQQRKSETKYVRGYVPAHKRTLSRSELDQQELARLEGMDNYSKYRMEKAADK